MSAARTPPCVYRTTGPYTNASRHGSTSSMPSSERLFRSTPRQRRQGAMRTCSAKVSRSSLVSAMKASEIKVSYLWVPSQRRPWAFISVAAEIEHVAAMRHGKCPRGVLLDHQDRHARPIDRSDLLEH